MQCRRFGQDLRSECGTQAASGHEIHRAATENRTERLFDRDDAKAGGVASLEFHHHVNITGWVCVTARPGAEQGKTADMKPSADGGERLAVHPEATRLDCVLRCKRVSCDCVWFPNPPCWLLPRFHPSALENRKQLSVQASPIGSRGGPDGRKSVIGHASDSYGSCRHDCNMQSL